MRAALLTLVLLASPASAHTGQPAGPDALWTAWRPEPLPALLIGLGLLGYGLGVSRLWRRAGGGRGISAPEAAAFLLGLAVTALALLSPLDAASRALLSAHMIQHVLLIAVAPPLLLIGRPDAAFAYVLPRAARHPLPRAALGGLRRLARPMPAALLHAAAIWIWHAPGPFQAALVHPLLHDLEHASFFVTALLFWQSVLAAMRSPASVIAAMLGVLFTLIQGGFLGALIALTGRPLYPAYDATELWGLTPLQDQQLAGLIMWVPASALYVIAGLMLAARLIGTDEPGSPSRGNRTGEQPADAVPHPAE
jgi:putative membrane protein